MKISYKLVSKMLAATICFLVIPADAFSKIHNSVSSLFGATSYGTLALNVGVQNPNGLHSQFAYKPIKIGATTKISFQDAYCFVVVHFGGTPVGAEHKYKFVRYSITEDGSKKPAGKLRDTPYDITNLPETSAMPSYCFRNTHPSGTKFLLEVDSTDGDWFKGSYTFLVK